MTLQFPRYLLASIVLLSISQRWVRTAPLNSTEIEFIILHNNDMHARFEQTGVRSNECLPKDIASNECYGGFARVAHEVRKFREEAAQPGGTPVIYLNAGDTYTGTPWFYVYKDNITSEFLNALKPDAISLGNHEFDDGIKGLVPFLNKVNFPVLIANLDSSNHPELTATKSLKPSTVLDIQGTKVGVIGYLLPETTRLSLVPTLKLIPEVQAINKEAQILKQQGVNIIIALGHSGYETDMNIAKECPLVDLVIGGHSNTFLYNGQAPSLEKPDGPYPMVVKQASGKEVPVIQAYAYTKYLGQLRVKFDKDGNLLKWNGNPILLNTQVPQDSDILKLLDLYRPGIIALKEMVVGHTAVLLDGDFKNCREMECNMGNMIADAYIYAQMIEYANTSSEFWSDTAIAFMQGGGIRTSIDKGENGVITRNDLMTAMPYGNRLIQTRVSGKTIRNMLEVSVSKLGKGYGGYLQVSGVQAVFDISKPSLKRVQSVRLLCAECNIPEYSNLEDDRMYNIIISDYILFGGDSYDIPHEGEKVLKVNDIEAVELYLKARSPVYPGVEWRLVYEGKLSEDGGGAGGGGVGHIVASGLLILATLFAHLLH